MNQGCLLNETINIPRLIYTPNYITVEYENELIALIDSQKWNLDLKRRTQHYGYKYDYTARSLDASYYLGEMLYRIGELCNKLHGDGVFIKKPDQVIINEYTPGQGIAPPVDCIPCFCGVIYSLSLASGCFMDLRYGNVRKSIYLEPRSLLVFQGDVRYKWKHGIAARKSDNGLRRGRVIKSIFRIPIATPIFVL